MADFHHSLLSKHTKFMGMETQPMQSEALDCGQFENLAILTGIVCSQTAVFAYANIKFLDESF